MGDEPTPMKPAGQTLWKKQIMGDELSPMNPEFFAQAEDRPYDPFSK
jgi:hypothetical protein